MTATVILGKAVAAAVRAQVAREVATLPAPPGLATVLVGDDPTSAAYITSKRRFAQDTPSLRPCTPAGVLELLDAYEVPLDAAHAVVVGRSALVGRPKAQLLLQRNATVTICHSRTRDLPAVCRTADVLIAAAGVPGLRGVDAIRPGATVIDVGIRRTAQGLCGDVDYPQVREIASAITPVPGGVGPMTIAMLLRNIPRAARPRTPAPMGLEAPAC